MKKFLIIIEKDGNYSVTVEYLCKHFNIPELVKKIWNSSVLKYRRLPQVVNFSGRIKVRSFDVVYL